MKVMNVFKLLVTVFGTAVTYMLGDFDKPLITLLIFVILDYITGVLVAWIRHELNSEVGFKGLFKKALIIVVLIMAVCLDRLLLTDDFLIRTIVCYFYIANEGISILENAGGLGVPIPQKIKNVLVQLKEESEEK